MAKAERVAREMRSLAALVFGLPVGFLCESIVPPAERRGTRALAVQASVAGPCMG